MLHVRTHGRRPRGCERLRPRNRRRNFALAAVALAALGLVAACAAPPGTPGLTGVFLAAEAETGVPAELLAAVAWTQTHFVHRATTVVAGDGGASYGLMGLHDRWPRHDLGRGAAMAGYTADEAAADAALNVLAAAHVIAQRAVDLSRDVSGDGRLPRADDWPAWIAAAADILGAGEGYAVAAARDDLAATLRDGLVATLSTGETIVIPPRAIGLDEPGSLTLGLADYPGAAWAPAYSGNYTSGRSGTAIDTVVIHTVQGSYAGAISWFMNSSANVSAHFVVRSSDGAVTQCVDLADTGWHAGNWSYNLRSVGIEHEGWVDDASWYTPELYMSSAAITAWLGDTYGFPTDRDHVIGHVEVPGATHTDPGPYWDWDYYMGLVNAPDLPPFAATLTGMEFPTLMSSGEERVAFVEFANEGNATWSADTRLGTTNPRDRESPFFHPANWIGPSRPTAADIPAATGDVSRFSFVLLAPVVTVATMYTEYFNLVEEGVEWFGPCDDCIAMQITVIPATGDDPGMPPDDPGNPDDPPDDIGAASGCACAVVGVSRGVAPDAFPGALALALLGIVAAVSRRRCA